MMSDDGIGDFVDSVSLLAQHKKQEPNGQDQKSADNNAMQTNAQQFGSYLQGANRAYSELSGSY